MILHLQSVGAWLADIVHVHKPGYTNTVCLYSWIHTEWKTLPVLQLPLQIQLWAKPLTLCQTGTPVRYYSNGTVDLWWSATYMSVGLSLLVFLSQRDEAIHQLSGADLSALVDVKLVEAHLPIGLRHVEFWGWVGRRSRDEHSYCCSES